MWLFIINPLKLCSYGSWSLQGYVCKSSCCQCHIMLLGYLKTLSVHFIDWWLCRSHSATQPLSRSARVADAATQPLCQSGWVADVKISAIARSICIMSKNWWTDVFSNETWNFGYDNPLPTVTLPSMAGIPKWRDPLWNQTKVYGGSLLLGGRDYIHNHINHIMHVSGSADFWTCLVLLLWIEPKSSCFNPFVLPESLLFLSVKSKLYYIQT